MRWQTTQVAEDEAQALAQAVRMPVACARILMARGYATPQAVRSLLTTDLSQIPDPFSLKGMEGAARRIAQAVVQKQRIAIFGDYDVDGVTSTATLFLFLKEVGVQAEAILPRRMVEGYGLARSVVEGIAAKGCDLLVTLDCGVTAVDEIALAKGMGMDVVVIDHHPPLDPPRLPPADAIVDPHQPDGSPAFDGRCLCAAGLAFLTCMALRKTLRNMGHFDRRPEPRLREYLDLTALGTIADVVPLTGVNRTLVRHGLDELARAGRPGVRALKRASGIDGNAPMSAGQVSYRLAPKINAAGRLDEAIPGFKLLTTASADEAFSIAAELDAVNTERQQIEQRIFDEALPQAERQSREGKRTVVVSGDRWHKGVVGIVASRLVERFHRPAIVIAMDQEAGEGTGSGRSPEGSIHLADALAKCDAYLTRHGGHHRAAGLSLNATSLEAFRNAFEEVACQTPNVQDEPVCHVDAEVALEEVNEALAEALKALEPFGMGNPEPTLALRGVRASFKVIQPKRGGTGHLKMFISGFRNLDIIGFGMGDKARLVAEGPVDIAFHLTLENFQRQKRLSLRLTDVAASSQAPLAQPKA